MTKLKNFSHLTLSAVKEILAEQLTNAELEALFFKYKLLDTYRGLGIASKKNKIMEIFHYLSTKGDEGSLRILSEIVSDAFKEGYYDDNVERFLAQDGYKLNDVGEIIPIVSSTVDTVKEEGLVETLLDKYRFTVAKKHLKQSYDNYLDGNWETSNAALRSFLQDVFDQISLLLYADDVRKIKTGGARRQLLQEKGFIVGRSEADLVKSFFTFASGKGSHPGISSEPDCRLRRYMCIALASYYLTKLEEHIL